MRVKYCSQSGFSISSLSFYGFAVLDWFGNISVAHSSTRDDIGPLTFHPLACHLSRASRMPPAALCICKCYHPWLCACEFTQVSCPSYCLWNKTLHLEVFHVLLLLGCWMCILKMLRNRNLAICSSLTQDPACLLPKPLT